MRAAQRRLVVIGALYEHGDGSLLDVARACRLRAGAVVPALAALERDGLVRVTRDHATGRRTYRLGP